MASSTFTDHHHHSQYDLIFIPTPTIGNLVPTVEFARHLLRHDHRFSATFLIIDFPERSLVNTYTHSISISSPNIHFIHLPPVDPPPTDHYDSFVGYHSLIFQNHKDDASHAISNLVQNSGLQLCSIFVDMFTTVFIDVAHELGVASYLFFASPATFLGFMLHLHRIPSESLNSESESVIPSFSNPLTPNLFPTGVLKSRDGYFWCVHHARRYTETKGIIVNTFQDLEPYALDSLSGRDYGLPLPPIYPIGPILDLAGPAQWHPNRAEPESITKWLDDQPPSSVVFLCFGSMGSLNGPQVREIAIGLERAGFRFLWALREPPKGPLGLPDDYSSVDEVLPHGFLERTAGMGKVCGWVPQVSILAHKAIGGFVSHCGWNSILESLWYGVPIATWPVYAEQQMNAFEMVKELGLAVEIRLDYRDGSNLVTADEVERGVKRLMIINGCDDDQIRRKVKLMREKCRATLMENGLSRGSLESLINALLLPTLE